MIDVNAYYGRYPFRDTEAASVGDLLRLMDRCGIEKAVVCPFEAAFQWDYERPNIRAHKELAPHHDRLKLLACVHPNYPGHMAHVRYCTENLDVAGFKLHPEFHAYALSDQRCVELAQRIGDSGRILFVAARVEDKRWYPPFVRANDVSVDAVIELARLAPQTKIILGGVRPGTGTFGRGDDKTPVERLRFASNVYFETSAVSTTDPGWHYQFAKRHGFSTGDAFQLIVDALGEDRVLFGTRLPVVEPMMSVLDLQESAIGASVRRKIVRENAERLFKLK